LLPNKISSQSKNVPVRHMHPPLLDLVLDTLRVSVEAPCSRSAGRLHRQHSTMINIRHSVLYMLLHPQTMFEESRLQCNSCPSQCFYTLCNLDILYILQSAGPAGRHRARAVAVEGPAPHLAASCHGGHEGIQPRRAVSCCPTPSGLLFSRRPAAYFT